MEAAANINTDQQDKDNNLPFDIEMEQYLLGNLISNPEHYFDVSEILVADDFYHPFHKKIFQTICDFSNKGLLISPLTIKNFFAGDEELKDSNNNNYINELAKSSATIINAKEYAKILSDLSVKRQLIDIGGDIVLDARKKDQINDAVSQIEAAEQKLFNLSFTGNTSSDFKGLSVSLNESLEVAEAAMKAGGFTGISTDFIDIDKMMGGLQDSDLIILAGRPSMGKTALAVNLALNSCEFLKNNSREGSVGFISLEMSSEQLSSRMISLKSGVNAKKFRSGNLSNDDFEKIIEAHKDLYDLPFYIDDTPALSISAIRTKARRLKRKHNLALLVIDYLQLVRGSGGKNSENRVQEISEITQGLKAIAKELNIPVIALSQLSRAVEQREDKRPQLSDLRESGSIEQDADLVLFIYREQYYVERKKPSEGSKEMAAWQEQMERVLNKAEVIVAKNRHGPVGGVDIYFDANTTRFSNLTSN